MISPALVDLAIAVGLGLLVGLQRESTRSQTAGLRTFALTTALGAVAALLAPSFGGWIFVAGFTAVAVLVAISHLALSRSPQEVGLTTEIALLLMYAIGAYLVAGDRSVGIVLAGAVAVLLQAKQPFQRVMQRLGDDDVRAIMQFALLALVILPALPDTALGPWGVLNPREIWLLVVLIVGINLAGYIAYKFFGSGTGTLLGGVLGGMISSTATTVTYARRTKAGREVPQATVVVVIATAVVVARMVVEIGVVSRELLAASLAPNAVVFAVALGLSLLLWWRSRAGEADEPLEHENPTRLRPAVAFAALYALVMLAVAWVRNEAGAAGLYAVAVVAGLTDVDAITLSTSRLVSAGRLEAGEAWRVILVAFVSNLGFKAGIVAFAGARALLWRVVVLFGVIGATALALVAFWPR